MVVTKNRELLDEQRVEKMDAIRHMQTENLDDDISCYIRYGSL